MYDSVIKQLRGAGLLIDSFEADAASIVRCKVEGDKNKHMSGWYRIFSVLSKSGNTYYVGSYGNWKNPALPEKGVSVKYESDGLSVEDMAAIRKKQEASQRVADKERKEKRKEAAERARKIWDGLSLEGSSKYLERKKVKPFGARFSRGSLCLPVRTVDGELTGLQFIDAAGRKKFLTGTAKAGCFHLLGDLVGASIVVLVEGYATGASIYMACNYPVVIAFDAGNLAKVSQVIRTKFPCVTQVIACDADTVGVEKARLAAAKTQAILCIPSFDEGVINDGEVLTDFNDLHIQQGLSAVEKRINSALREPILVVAKPEVPIPKDVSPQASNEIHGYLVKDSGVYWIDPNGEDEAQYRVCGRLDVLAFARTEEGRDWGLMVSFNNYDGERCEWFIPQRLFGSDRPAQILEGLFDRGFEVDAHRKSKQRLVEYLQKAKPKKRVRLINRFGWFGDAYVSPTGVIGSQEETLHYYTDRKLLNRSAIAGSLGEWRTLIASKCVGNPLLMFAVSISFSGPLLSWMGYRTMGFHMMGPSSLGKSTLSAVAGSVCGGSDYFRTWNTTAAALESTAAEHSDSVLILDEINQADPLTVGQTIYQLGNEEGRARATDTGSSTRAQHKWRLMWLSNGERSLKEIQSRAGKVTEAGMEMRLLHIRADLHSDQKERDAKGIYQNLHGFAHGAALSEYLKQQVSKNHGQPLVRFIEVLASLSTDARAKMLDRLHLNIERFQASNLSEAASGQARRAAMAFAFVGECGELSSQFGITDWPEGEAREAAALLYRNFLRDRGGEGNTEDKAILEQICLQLQTKGESHFTRWDKLEATVDTHQPRSMTRWGYRKVENTHKYGDESFSEEEFYIYKEVFRREVCKGVSYRRACELLQERGALVTTKGKGFLHQKVLPGSGRKQTQIYCIKMAALNDLLPEVEGGASSIAA